MKKDTALKRKTSRIVAKNLIILFVLLVVAFVGVMSWFTKSTSATADGISLECEAPDGIEIAIMAPGETPDSKENSDDYKQGTISLNKDDYDFMETLYMREITGDGVDFCKPLLTQTNGVAEPITDSSSVWPDAAENIDYLTFDLYIRSKTTQTISLSEDTEIAPLSKDLGSGTSFSQDCVVGAARFSIVDTNASRKLLWIPAPNIFYNSEDKTIATNIADTSAESYTHTYYYYVSSTNEKIKNSLTSDDGVTVNTAGDYTLGEKTQLVELKSKDDNGYYVNHVTCNLWIEGEDAEAKLAFVGGNFTVSLKLTLN